VQIAGEQPEPLADELVALLWNGQTELLLGRLEELSTRAGEPQENDPPTHPRVVLAKTAAYLQKTSPLAYRAKGWPIGSGITESGVKLFGKRVKGTEQFGNVQGAEAVLALRATWLSEDEESRYYWLGRPPQAAAA
jgi:hypothetical protein